jgi:hypothetical protein
MKLKIALVILMLIPLPFSCSKLQDTNDGLDLYVEPYYNILGMVFTNVDLYYKTGSGTPMFTAGISQDYENEVYPCDSMALHFIAPDSLLMFHSQLIKSSFSLIPEAYAAERNRPGYAGTLDLVDKIYISSNYDFDETHNKTDNMSDIVDILPYTPNVREEWRILSDYNKNSPYPAPKRFSLFLKRKPTRSNIQQFVIRYYVKTEEGGNSKHFDIVTPVFHVR